MIMHNNAVDVGTTASRGPINQGTNPTPSLIRRDNKRRRMTSEALLHDSESFPSPVTLGQYSEALVFTNDTLPVDDPVLPVNVAPTPVVNPSGPIATAWLDDTLSSARNATGRRTRKKLRLQRSFSGKPASPNTDSGR